MGQDSQSSEDKRQHLAFLPAAPTLGGQDGQVQRQSPKQNACGKIAPKDQLFVPRLLLQKAPVGSAVRSGNAMQDLRLGLKDDLLPGACSRNERSTSSK